MEKCKDQNAFDDAMKTYLNDDSKAQKIIVTSIGKEPTLHTMNCKSAREIWNKLEGIYERKSKIFNSQVAAELLWFYKRS